MSAQAQAQETPSDFVGEHLVVDSAPSPHGSDTAAWPSTASLSSSVTSFRMEFGRRYHAFNDDAYWLPNDEEEMTRLDLQHVIWSLCLKGQLHIAPLQAANIERVLDVGTGTGKWAIEFADANPKVSVVGTDLSPIQPPSAPPNCSFVVENVEKDWVFSEPFDYIHGRMLMLGIHDWAKYFRQCFDHLKSGGWCEVQEAKIPIQSADPNMQSDWPLREWGLHVVEAITLDGIDPDPSPKFKAMMEEVGFVNVREQPLKWPVGPWAEGKREKLIGRINVDNCKQACRPGGMALFTKRLGWTVAQVEEYMPKVEQDIADSKRLYYIQIRIVIGQKPEAPK